MRDFFIDMFIQYAREILFLHVSASALLIGSLCVVGFLIRPLTFESIDAKTKLTHSVENARNYFYFLIPVMILIVLSSLFMHLGLGFKSGNPTTYVMVHTKEALWTFIAFNFGYMYLKYRKAVKSLKEENYLEVEENIILMVKYLIPLNAILSLISVYFGVILRGF